MLSFIRGQKYSRADVKEQAGLSRDSKGGSWDTGIVEHAGEFLIFTNVGTEGRTGHDYGNRWEDLRERVNRVHVVVKFMDARRHLPIVELKRVA